MLVLGDLLLQLIILPSPHLYQLLQVLLGPSLQPSIRQVLVLLDGLYGLLEHRLDFLDECAPLGPFRHTVEVLEHNVVVADRH